MDNKSKCLYVAVAILLASNGYLLYRLGNVEGIVHAFESSNEEPKAKDNTPIGKYIPEGEGLKFDDVVINKLYLRDDGKVEIDGEVNGEWQEYKGHYKIACDELGRRVGSSKAKVTNSGARVYLYLKELTIRIDENHLTITSYVIQRGFTGNRYINLSEKDFIRYKRVDK